MLPAHSLNFAKCVRRMAVSFGTFLGSSNLEMVSKPVRIRVTRDGIDRVGAPMLPNMADRHK